MRFNKLDLNLLAALDVLIKTRSVTRAADEMFITQSAMSNALGRLRIFFDDPLLVQVGRSMELSPLAETLQEPLREIMTRVDAATRIRPHFDPLTDDRVFNLVISDYSLAVMGAQLSQRIAALAPNIQLNLRPQHAHPSQLLDRGEADLVILPDFIDPEGHAHELLFEDHLVVLVADDGPHATAEMTEERFGAAPHVVMEPFTAQESFATVTMRVAGVVPHKVLSTYLFSSIPELIRKTDRIALIQGLLAQQALRRGGFVIKPAPFPCPPLRQSIRWQSHRSRDPGLMWLRDQIMQAMGDVLAE
ncbi:LysR family transcriptional regulator [Paracoccus aestuariivivens]|uniref:LysR family transcriptional regulator n=1 Tax=Paracoccus aestuariivivens TaxID=1820333 RepID=A0A6L6JDK0_9RHOB|nr:LysR family transcriptional regulator [Paracoccus aestuariivivens]MTH79596.1 LysR family transcriptional regulator [Paracoccus aestuariivivens]